MNLTDRPTVHSLIVKEDQVSCDHGSTTRIYGIIRVTS